MPDAVSRIGGDAKEYGFHTKGQSFTYNCTQAIAMSLASSVATRGADHLKGHPFRVMIGLAGDAGKNFRQGLPEGILERFKSGRQRAGCLVERNYKSFMDSLGVCFVPMVGCDVFADPLILV